MRAHLVLKGMSLLAHSSYTLSTYFLLKVSPVQHIYCKGLNSKLLIPSAPHPALNPHSLHEQGAEVVGSSDCFMEFHTGRPKEKHLNVFQVFNSSLSDFFFSYWQEMEAGW